MDASVAASPTRLAAAPIRSPAFPIVTHSLVTGAGGFIGGHLCRALASRGEPVRAVSSRPVACAPAAGVGLLERSDAALAAALAEVETVYFLAGIAHQRQYVEASADPDGERALQTVNVAAPERWLRAADQAGVRRFVWVSSIKVLGDRSERPLLESDPYRPEDAYARSKAAAERALLAVPRQTTGLTIVRPPLVYGPGVRGNFLTLLQWAASPMPLPLAGAAAPRSLVAWSNLCDLLICAGRQRQPQSAGDGLVLHASDDGDVSVAALVTEVRERLGRRAGLFALPPRLLRQAAARSGRLGLYTRLFEPLQVDTGRTRQILGWQPPVTRAQALTETVAWLRTLR